MNLKCNPVLLIFVIFIFCYYPSVNLMAQIPQLLQGGSEVGNGGDAVVCSSSLSQKKVAKKEVTEVVLLDFYEAQALRNWTLDLEFKNQKTQKKDIPKTADEIAKLFLQNLAKTDTKLSEQYLKRFESFWSESKLFPRTQLTDIPDSAHLVLPANCMIQQVVIRQEQILPGEKRFLISQDLWEKLSPFHQAGLIVHEIVYEHFRFLGEKNSIKARYFNSWLFSQEREKTDREHYRKMFQQLGLAHYP